MIDLDFSVLFQDIKITAKDIQKSTRVLYYLALINQAIQVIMDLMVEL